MVDFYHRIFYEMILFCMYLKDGTFKWKIKCISNRCALPYPSIKGHREKSPKRIFLKGGAHHSVCIALYPSPCIPIASSLNSLFIRVCPMSIGFVVPELSSRHCTHVRLFPRCRAPNLACKPYGEIRRSARAHVLWHFCHDTWKSLSRWVSTYIPNFNPIRPAVSELQTRKFFKFKNGVCTCACASAPHFSLF